MKKPSYKPRNVDRREHRNKLHIKSLNERMKIKESEIKKLKRLVQTKDSIAQKLQEEVDTTSLKLDTAEKLTEKSLKSSQGKVQKLQKVLDSVLSDCDALEDSLEELQVKMNT